ncbi:MAG: GspH/FimT family pseudopilin [Rhodoferax sp.]|jgi:type IV fimbrial biogenesis protein FimT|uniref:GspH/FimT family pseudopilin n=1 Tax=Rhodoferax sp. TaxID=50421 RepID=UPI001B536781|nr:GspH/FimT family pseudopilin [Rhodoferax sp.]MBP8287375.1 GspH/FimT family pseudopilin [Rhodoferax sp.]MBP9149687.1 GspH/FimT family pseudopilin [Rhodoferax sp.]MBP9737217.1 GspH/FimT family pseudopilin [Rhodoferax sp.]
MSNRIYSTQSAVHTRPVIHSAARCAGFTVIELMVTVAVLGILLAVAVPSFLDFVASGRGSSISSGFVVDMTRARAEAISANTCVKICQSDNAPNGASATCASSGDDWQRGWIMFRLPTCNTGLTNPVDTDVFSVRVGDYADFEFFTTSGTVRRFFVFDPRGVLIANGNGNLTLSHLPEGINSKHTRTVCVSFAGRVTVREYGGSTGCTS